MLEVDSGCQICLSGSSQIISDIVKSCDRRKLKSSLTWLQYMDEDALYGCRVMVNNICCSRSIWMSCNGRLTCLLTTTTHSIHSFLLIVCVLHTIRRKQCAMLSTAGSPC